MRHVIQDDDNVEINYVPYPVQDSIPYLPESIKQRCLKEISSISAISEAAKNFDEFTLKSFGETLQAIFIRPYNEKVCKSPFAFSICSITLGFGFSRLILTSSGKLRENEDFAVLCHRTATFSALRHEERMLVVQS